MAEAAAPVGHGELDLPAGLPGLEHAPEHRRDPLGLGGPQIVHRAPQVVCCGHVLPARHRLVHQGPALRDELIDLGTCSHDSHLVDERFDAIQRGRGGVDDRTVRRAYVMLYPDGSLAVKGAVRAGGIKARASSSSDGVWLRLAFSVHAGGAGALRS